MSLHLADVDHQWVQVLHHQKQLILHAEEQSDTDIFKNYKFNLLPLTEAMQFY